MDRGILPAKPTSPIEVMIVCNSLFTEWGTQLARPCHHWNCSNAFRRFYLFCQYFIYFFHFDKILKVKRRSVQHRTCPDNDKNRRKYGSPMIRIRHSDHGSEQFQKLVVYLCHRLTACVKTSGGHFAHALYYHALTDWKLTLCWQLRSYFCHTFLCRSITR